MHDTYGAHTSSSPVVDHEPKHVVGCCMTHIIKNKDDILSFLARLLGVADPHFAQQITIEVHTEDYRRR